MVLREPPTSQPPRQPPEEPAPRRTLPARALESALELARGGLALEFARSGGGPQGLGATLAQAGLAPRHLSVADAEGGAADDRQARRTFDAALVARALKGDDQAFGALVERYQRQVYWVAHDVLLDAEEARDVAQETFLRVHGALERFDVSRDFVNWLYRIARNLAIDAHRRRKRRPTPVEDLGEVEQPTRAGALGGAEAASEAHELRLRVNQVLADLPLEYRLALTLRELHGLTPLEIARVTDCTYPTSRWRLHRARGLFKKRWQERYGAAPAFGEDA
jgi:RNA polymerase sigma-70 factor (ECF subfamily)